jgi:hypothetical protein
MSDSDGRRSASFSRPAETFCLVAVLLGLTAVWLLVAAKWPVGFWHAHDDYVYLSLAHALNLDAEIADHRWYTDGGLTGHPGIPFYFISWLCLRAAGLVWHHADLAQFALADPQPFFLMTRIAALLLTLLAVAAAWHVLDELPVLPRVLALIAPFASDYLSFVYGLSVLGTETFALPVYVLLFWVVRRMGAPRQPTAAVLLAAGAASSAAYLIKLLYLDVLAGALGATLATAYGFAFGLRLRRLATVIVTFVAASFLILLVVMRWKDCLSLLGFHLAIIAHSRIYGAGSETVVSPEAMFKAVLALLRWSPLPYQTILALVLIGALLRRRGRMLGHRTRVWLAAAVPALLLVWAAVLKHYDGHYVVAISALMPFVWAPVLAAPRLRHAAAAAILLGLPLSIPNAYTYFHAWAADAQMMAEDEKAVLALPLASDEARLWTYRVPSRQFAEAFVVAYAGIPALSARLEQPNLQDYSTTSRVRRSYRYVILDRGYFPDAQAFHAALGGAFWPTSGFAIRYCPSDKVLTLQRTLVVELAGDCPGEPGSRPGRD